MGVGALAMAMGTLGELAPCGDGIRYMPANRPDAVARRPCIANYSLKYNYS